MEQRVVTGGPRGNISLRIVRPAHSMRALPVVMYFHGGGWSSSDEGTHDRLIREIAEGAQAAVVFLDYSRSLEVSTEVAIEEAYAATLWVAANDVAIGVDASNVAVAGDSVGGNVSAAVALLAKERFGPRISAQVLFFPATSASQPAASSAQDPALSPLNASISRLRGLPPALVITSTLDVLRDQAETYVDRLVAAGVTVTFSRYFGVLHDLVTGKDGSAPHAAVAQANAMLRRAFAH